MARISLRDTATGKVVRQLSCPAYDIVPGSPQGFLALTFTADGKGLLTSGPDHCLRIWDPLTGKELARLPLEELPGSLALSRDGKKLAVAIEFGKAICIVDLTRWQTMTPSRGHLMEVMQATLTPDGRTAVTGCPLGPLFIWDVASGKVSRHWERIIVMSSRLRLGHDGRTIYTLGWDNTLRIWDLETAEERRRVVVEHDMGRLQRAGLALTPDGKTLAVLDQSRTIRILDTASGRGTAAYPRTGRSSRHEANSRRPFAHRVVLRLQSPHLGHGDGSKA